ncbi:ATP-binding protein [Candidatus Nitrosotalea okcheonensis]|uniref:AAA+ ATPase domain-containing protein n=1 Tax=Candidatus Nitrosotalea okcheonensis TaxID=1903276 RepID=A0A2H1FHI0_9ARCH|nr:ATP-binding protein [Candidatus Nitrosotalea okcheonensis]SMH72230.1 protein of unknown function [Candidatus Nitrosotalea okcheonensis]
MTRKRTKITEKDLSSEPEILRILYQHNPWWMDKPIPDIKLKKFKQSDYFYLEQELENNKITAVIGARQVGKTTMLYQLIEKLLSNNKPQNVFFLSLDDQYLKITLQNLNKIFEIYALNIIKIPLDELKQRVYFFLDEIQTVQDWEIILKRWYDLGYKIKFIISGSSSMNILQGTSESLVGRIKPQTVLPMKFLEYIRLKEQNKLGELTNATNLEMRRALKHSIIQNKAKPFYKACTVASKLFSPFKDKMMVYLNQYVIKGGYPEIAFIDNMALCAENLRNYLHLTLYKDIMRTGKIRDPVALENLVSILAKESSQIINHTNIAKNLDLKRETLNTYLYLLKTVYLISESEFYSKSRVKRIRKEKKVYVNDIGIRNMAASALDDQILTDSTEVGKMIETVIADHTKRLKFNLEQNYSPPLFYWREKYEVDIILDLLQKPLPIEVKYREQIQESDLRGLNSFKENFKVPMSLVLTKDHLEMDGSTIFMPSWLYMIMC